MITKSVKPYTKAVFARLKPTMTREQIKRNLIAALEKSGFTIHLTKKLKDKEGQYD